MATKVQPRDSNSLNFDCIHHWYPGCDMVLQLCEMLPLGKLGKGTQEGSESVLTVVHVNT